MTVNDYLAKRDSEWMGKVHRFLGLKVGLIIHGLNTKERQEAYKQKQKERKRQAKQRAEERKQQQRSARQRGK